MTAAVPVTIVIPALRRPELLDRCIISLRRHAPGADAVVVLNGATDDVRAVAVGHDGIRVVEAPTNLGFAGGCNLGAAASHEPFIGFLNDDAEVTEGWLDALVAALVELPRAGLVGSLQVSHDGVCIDAGADVDADGRFTRRGNGLRVEDLTFERAAVAYVSAASVLIRREAWEAVRGFDEGFFPGYFEDVDLCFRLRRAGWDSVIEPKSVVLHKESATLDERRRAFAYARNEARFRARWYGGAETAPAEQWAEDSDARIRQALGAALEFECDLTTHLSDELAAIRADRDWARGELERTHALYQQAVRDADERERLLKWLVGDRDAWMSRAEAADRALAGSREAEAASAAALEDLRVRAEAELAAMRARRVVRLADAVAERAGRWRRTIR